MKRSRLLALMLLTALGGGCASAPIRYHSLTPAEPSTAVAASAACCGVDLRPVRIPAQVDRPELVARRTDEQFIVFSNELWLAPLRDEIRVALLAEIDRKIMPSVGEAPQKPKVFVTIERFEAALGRYALIDAAWHIEPAVKTPQSTALACSMQAQVAVGEGIAALVLGYQQALMQIADQIAKQSCQ